MDRIELYVGDQENSQHPQLNDNVQYVHLTHVQTIDNASCMEIEVGNCLDYVLERDQLLSIIISKLRYGGIIKLNGTNLEEVMYNASVGKLNTPQVQQWLYSGRLSVDSYSAMITKLTQSQLTIINDSFGDNQYFLTAKRELPNG